MSNKYVNRNGCIEHQYYQTFARESEQSCSKNARRRKQKQQVERFLIFVCKKIQKQMFYSKKKRIEFRSKRVNLETNFRAIYTCTSISVQTRGLRKRWFGNNFLLEAFEASGLSGWGFKVTHLISLALLGTCF